MLSFQAVKEGVSKYEKTGDKFEPTAIFMTNFENQNCQRAFSAFNARFRLQFLVADSMYALFSTKKILLKVKFFFKHNSFYTEPQRFGGMFLLPISEHLPVRLHESLLDAETLKPALSRQ